MKQLWAPWRMEYIKSDKSEDCIFCSLPREGDDTKNYILYRGQSAFIIMNIFPYNSAHLMVSPFRHFGCLTEQDTSEIMELNQLTQVQARMLPPPSVEIQEIEEEQANVGWMFWRKGRAKAQA